MKLSLIYDWINIVFFPYSLHTSNSCQKMCWQKSLSVITLKTEKCWLCLWVPTIDQVFNWKIVSSEFLTGKLFPQSWNSHFCSRLVIPASAACPLSWYLRIDEKVTKKWANFKAQENAFDPPKCESAVAHSDTVATKYGTFHLFDIHWSIIGLKYVIGTLC